MRKASLPRAHRQPARAESRLDAVLDAAAMQFAAKGYLGASVRDIVREVGMLPGSLYCHFATKDELLGAVYQEGVRRIAAAVSAAVARHDDPWKRLEAACVAHLEAVLDRSAYAKVVISVEPRSVPELTDTLVSLRDGYESTFAALIDALPLPSRTSRRTLRLMLLGALNWTPSWYRPDGPRTPQQLARAYVQLLQAPVQVPPRSVAAPLAMDGMARDGVGALFVSSPQAEAASGRCEGYEYPVQRPCEPSVPGLASGRCGARRPRRAALSAPRPRRSDRPATARPPHWTAGRPPP